VQIDRPSFIAFVSSADYVIAITVVSCTSRLMHFITSLYYVRLLISCTAHFKLLYNDRKFSYKSIFILLHARTHARAHTHTHTHTHILAIAFHALHTISYCKTDDRTFSHKSKPMFILLHTHRAHTHTHSAIVQ
jgi:hypothetical protein